MNPERELAERLRKYASGAMVEGADLARAAAYLDQLVRENERFKTTLENIAMYVSTAADMAHEARAALKFK
jgi:hypothetical protein